MQDKAQQALELHKVHGGKISTHTNISVTSTDDLALVYTPYVADVSKQLAAHPETASTYSIKGNTVAVVSDGSAVLGLGNIGPYGALPVMEGKCLLFKTLGGVNAFPICLDTQDPEEIIATVKRIAPVFGGINLEDIAAPQCFAIESRLREELDIPVVHDDQHGTAIVVLAALINALTLTKRTIDTTRIVLSGAGAAGVAVASLLHAYGARHLVLCDSKGIISPHRTDLNQSKQELLTWTNPDHLDGQLPDALRNADVFIGISAAGALHGTWIPTMATDPIIFALANPTPEIMPNEAWSNGAKIVATGRSDFPNQINNALAFPGLFKGALQHGIKKLEQEHFIAAAQAIAGMAQTDQNEIVPGVLTPGVADAVAAALGAVVSRA